MKVNNQPGCYRYYFRAVLRRKKRNGAHGEMDDHRTYLGVKGNLTGRNSSYSLLRTAEDASVPSIEEISLHFAQKVWCNFSQHRKSVAEVIQFMKDKGYELRNHSAAAAASVSPAAALVSPSAPSSATVVSLSGTESGLAAMSGVTNLSVFASQDNTGI